MRIGIFLLYEGIPSTIIESQVLAHVKRMVELGYKIEVWSFAVTAVSYAEAKQKVRYLANEYPTIKVRVYRGFKPAIPFSELVNALILLGKFYLNKVHPSFVHARTEHAASIAAIAKKFMKFRLVWDARGDAISEFAETSIRFNWYIRWLVPIKLRAISKRLLLSQRNSDYGLFVSGALRDLQKGVLPEDQTAIVPCVGDERLFYYSDEVRSITRKKLCINENDFVITYVGSTAIWQCISETVRIIEFALSVNENVRALIISPNFDAIRKLFNENNLNRIIFISSKLSEINSFLNASDMGILLRKHNRINYVASPVKYAEYSLSGLTVLTTDAVDQVMEYGKIIKNTVNVNDLNKFITTKKITSIDRAEISSRANLYYSRSEYDKKFKAAYGG